MKYSKAVYANKGWVTHNKDNLAMVKILVLRHDKADKAKVLIAKAELAVQNAPNWVTDESKANLQRTIDRQKPYLG